MGGDTIDKDTPTHTSNTNQKWKRFGIYKQLKIRQEGYNDTK